LGKNKDALLNTGMAPLLPARLGALTGLDTPWCNSVRWHSKRQEGKSRLYENGCKHQPDLLPIPIQQQDHLDVSLLQSHLSWHWTPLLFLGNEKYLLSGA
jgi:hypothetical protein